MFSDAPILVSCSLLLEFHMVRFPPGVGVGIGIGVDPVHAISPPSPYERHSHAVLVWLSMSRQAHSLYT